MSRQKAKIYTEEFKRSSAKLAAESNEPMGHTANEVGISAKALYR